MAGSLDQCERQLADAARRWIVRLTSGDMTEYELYRFRKWVAEPDHKRVFRCEMTMWRQLGQLREPLAETMARSSFPDSTPKRVSRWRTLGMAIAGTLALLAVVFVLHHQASHLTDAAQKRGLLSHPIGASFRAGRGHKVQHHRVEGGEITRPPPMDWRTASQQHFSHPVVSRIS